MQTETFIDIAKAVLSSETQAITAMADKLDNNFGEACELLLATKGKVIVTGMGKSGHIGKKIAATLASTGTPSFFVHPSEASHGDVGMISSTDIIIAISNSGRTKEVVCLLPIIKRLGCKLIVLAGQADSALAQHADVFIDVGVAKEACPLDLAPTSSTTATMAMGDAIAIALLTARGFNEEDYAFSHPGGNLGQRLLLRVDDLMHTGDALPKVAPQTLLADALLEMSNKNLGMTAVVNEQNQLVGLFTDGDLRRAIEHQVDVYKVTIAEVMTKDCKTVKAGSLAATALNLMQKHKLNGLLVLNEQNQLIGAFNMQDLLHSGLV